MTQARSNTARGQAQVTVPNGDTSAIALLENQAAWHLDRSGVNGISREEQAFHLRQVQLLGEALLQHPTARAQAHNLLGRSALEQGHYRAAAKHLTAAVKAAPNDAGIRFSLGHLALLRQQLSDAAQHFRQAMTLDPNATVADQSLAFVKFRSGLFAEAFGDYRRLVRKYPNQWVLKTRLLECASRVKADYDDPGLSADVITLLQTPDLDHQHLGPLAGSLLVHRYRLDNPNSQIDLNALISDPLLQAALHKILFVQPELDDLLATLRETVLHHHLSLGDLDPALLELTVSLARYGLNSEFVLPLTAGEETTIASLTAHCTALCKAEDWSGLAVPLCLLAMYEPLSILTRKQGCQIDRQALAAVGPDSVAALLAAHFDEDTAERKRTEAIKTLTPIAAPVSRAVQSQYEENPYPRWKYLPKYSTSHYHHAVAAEVPAYVPTDQSAVSPIRMLVAGTGTGRHALHLARHFYDADVTAIDLSRRSLAYGEHMAETLGITNVRFAQADILQLDGVFDEPFSVIECSGVLHHMADPMAGWRALCDQLAPGGLMKVGLYSTRARAIISRLRTVISEQGLAATPQDIRRFRHSLLQDAQATELATLIQSEDFYSMSGVRDLLFHVQEHTFTPAELSSMIDQLPLRFLGFVLPASARRSYQHFFPADKHMNRLDNWHRLEQDNPNLFTGMYQLYLQKT